MSDCCEFSDILAMVLGKSGKWRAYTNEFWAFECRYCRVREFFPIGSYGSLDVLWVEYRFCARDSEAFLSGLENTAIPGSGAGLKGVFFPPGFSGVN